MDLVSVQHQQQQAMAFSLINSAVTNVGAVGGPLSSGTRLSALSDDFVMFTWKTAECSKKYCHDWAVCPFAHANENSRRRSPKAFPYSAVICQQKKQTHSCPRGDACHMSHSAFEYWLHPDRYHTELCRMGSRCSRRMCFFAHRTEELRTPNASRRPQPTPSTHQTLPAPSQVAAPAAAAPAGLAGAEPCLQDSRPPLVLQAPPMLVLSAPTAGSAHAPQQPRRSSSASSGAACAAAAAAAPGVQSSAGVFTGQASSTSTSTPMSMHQADTMVLPAFWPQHSNNSRPSTNSSGAYPAGNRQHRRQHLQQGGGKGAGVGAPSGVSMAMAPQAVAHGLLSYPAAAYPSHPSTAAPPSTAMAQLQAQLAGLSLLPPSAALLYSQQPAVVVGGFGGGGGGVLPMQPAMLQQYGQQGLQYHISDFNSQPVVWGAGGGAQVSGSAGGQFFVHQQHRAPVPVSAAEGAVMGTGYGVMPAAQGYAGVLYQQQAPATAGMQGYAMGGNISVESGGMMQQMVMPVHMGVQAAPRHLPTPAGSAAFALQATPGNYSFQ